MADLSDKLDFYRAQLADPVVREQGEVVVSVGDLESLLAYQGATVNIEAAARECAEWLADMLPADMVMPTKDTAVADANEAFAAILRKHFPPVESACPKLVESGNALDQLSLHALTFLMERTDFSEPWLGMGFASSIKSEIEKALARKSMARAASRAPRGEA